jgi:predicted DsbA family dithiol-disulfide isomerase
MIHLDIFSDPVCPWCYIGKAHLDRALASRPDHPFIIEWHPFQLNPDLPPDGRDRAGYLEQKFGGRAKAAAIYARVEEAAVEAGVEIDFAAMKHQPNTLNAHRLIHWAGLEGRQTAVKSSLMRAFFREGRDIGDTATLVAIAGATGMDEAVVARLLASDADRAEIMARDMDSRRKGVTAVPTFLVARQYVVQGAQPPEVWAQVIDELITLPNP